MINLFWPSSLAFRSFHDNSTSEFFKSGCRSRGNWTFILFIQVHILFYTVLLFPYIPWDDMKSCNPNVNGADGSNRYLYNSYQKKKPRSSILRRKKVKSINSNYIGNLYPALFLIHYSKFFFIFIALLPRNVQNVWRSYIFIKEFAIWLVM